jgi:hypothetical protein
VFVTNQRVVFLGSKQTRECLYSKTIGISHDDAVGETTMSVSYRQKPTVIHYGPAVAGNFDFRLELAIAHSKGTVSDLVARLRSQLEQIEGERPVGPAEPVTQRTAVVPSAPPPPLLPPPPSAVTADATPADHKDG